MSVPVRYSANFVDENMSTAAIQQQKPSSSMMMMANNMADNAEMRNQWMMIPEGGRLGTPDAAAVVLNHQHHHHHHHLQNHHNEHKDEINANNANIHQQQQQTSQNSFNNEHNFTSSEELLNKLKEYYALQDKYHTALSLPKESKREITAGGRDGSAYVLRCLKMWYELPSEVLFAAISLVDRFLDRMTVKPKHMACLSVASFHLAIKQLGLNPIPPEDLVTISQCGCTAGDLERMAGVIANKLGVQIDHAPVTSLSFLRIYYNLLKNLSVDIGGSFEKFYHEFIKLEELEMRLEALLCDVRTTIVPPSTLAFVLICLHLDFHIKQSFTHNNPELKHLFEYILFLQQFLNIPDGVFDSDFSVVSGILSHYNGQNKQPYKQRLIWKLSSRTLKVLRPMNRFSSDLPTIQEGIANFDDNGCRSRSESVSSVEEEDWPTSPVIPIYEQC